MSKKFTQEEVAQYFKEHGYELLSEYKNVNSKVKVRNAKGEDYNVKLAKFKLGQRPERKVVKFTQEEVAQYFKKHGYELLSEYKGNSKKVRIKNSKGSIYDITIASFKKGHRPENRNISYTQEELEKYFISEGYALVSTYKGADKKVVIRNPDGEEYSVFLNNFKRGMRPERRLAYTCKDVSEILSREGYTLSSPYVSAKEDIVIVCKAGHTLVTSLTLFNQGRRCSACANNILESGMSTGEHLVWSVLENNRKHLSDIRREVRVTIEGELHRFDFMFKAKGKHYIVEYDGLQHYKETFFGNLKHRKDRDSVKDNYAESKGITLIRIPYTTDTLPEVVNFLEVSTGVTLEVPHGLLITSISEVVEYYLRHSLTATCEKYGLDAKRVTGYFKTTNGMSKTMYLRQHPELKA